MERSDVDSLGSLSGKWAASDVARATSISSTCQPIRFSINYLPHCGLCAVSQGDDAWCRYGLVAMYVCVCVRVLFAFSQQGELASMPCESHGVVGAWVF